MNDIMLYDYNVVYIYYISLTFRNYLTVYLEFWLCACWTLPKVLPNTFYNTGREWELDPFGFFFIEL